MRRDVKEKELEDALESGREALKTDDTAQIDAATETITQASHKLAELMYKEQEEQGAASEDEQPEGEQPEEDAEAEDKSDDDVIDAEFTEK